MHNAHRPRLLVTAAAFILLLALVALLTGALGATGTRPGPPTATLTPSPSATATPTARPSHTPLPPTMTPSATATPSPTGTPTAPPPQTPLPVESPAPDAWLHRATPHYDIYYLPDSPAAHDIDTLAKLAEEAMRAATTRLQTTETTRIRIYFVNRIYYQGGASYSHNELLLSYPPPDRDYMSTDLETVLRHETAHALVEQFLGSDRHKGGLLGEGVAVWTAGGHYQPESLAPLAATLIGDNAGLYLPLPGLQRDFDNAQHEIAYLEGGAFVQFLVERWGLPKFKQYLDQPDNPQPIYRQDLAGLEQAWRTWLAAQPHTAADSEAVRLRVRYYDLVRRYEATLDPDARVLPGQPPSQWGLTLIGMFNHPASAPTNVALEHEFVQAGAALWSRNLTTCARLLDDLAARIPAS
ncbi:MAG TPA: hypothetical protein VFM49_05595 [Chloroflexia bacterium]|jgi:hypothetical protein|nr:hypothetical protein [Chloroflexia bacterium]